MGGWKRTLVAIIAGACFFYLKSKPGQPLWMLAVLGLLLVIGIAASAMELASESPVRKFLHWALLAGFLCLLYIFIRDVINGFIATTG